MVRVAGGRRLPQDFSFTGDVFTDGALRGGGPVRARRSGWAAVLVSSSGHVIEGLYGTCPDAFPSSLRAELWAVLQMLVIAIPPFTVWTDSAGVVDGWHRGRVWCCASCRPAADLWRKIWWRLDDMGCDGIDIRKVKGHATEADVEAGRSTPWERECNDHADHFAKRGVEVAEAQLPSDSLRARYREARAWYSWLAELIGHWPADTQDRSTQRAEAARRPAPPNEGAVRNISSLQVHEALPHELGEVEGSLRCSKCGKGTCLSQDWGHIKGFAKGKCLGTTRQRVLDAAARSRLDSTRDALGHVLYQSGNLTWCWKCGHWGVVRPRKLLESCCGISTQHSQLKRLKDGYHPLSKAPLGTTHRI